MSIGSVANSHESSHIWLCDEQGDVHVLRDLEMYTASVNPDLSIKETATTEVDPPTLPSPGPPWTKQGVGFSTVVGGYSGIVCGIQEAELCVRLGVTHDNPLGNSWSKMYCKATEVAVGSYFIIRRILSGALFTVDMSAIDFTKKKSLLVLNWQAIPPCPSDLWKNDVVCEPTFISLDKYDNFFLIDSTGNVCMYSSLGLKNARWSKVCSAPSIGKGWGILKWLSLWREDEQQGQLSRVSPGKQSVWCSMKNSSTRVFWQLVLSFQSRAGVELKTNWTRIDIPFEDEMVCFCADKCEVSGLVCVVKTEDTTETLLKYCLNFNSDEAKNSSPLVISGPFSSCRSISICRTSVMSTPSSNQLSVRARILRVSTGSTSTQSGQLPPLDLKQERSSDVCCENGDCYYCQQAANQPSVSVILEDSEQRIAGGRKRGLVLASEETCPPKRPRVHPMSYPLVEGVDIMYKYQTQSTLCEVMV